MQRKSVFDDVTLTFAGKEYKIPANMMMGAIARIEEFVTLKELHDIGSERATLKLSPIASAYAAALRYAGAKVADDEVYAGMFAGGASSQVAVIGAVQGLISMMIPPSALRKEPPPGEGNRQARRGAASLSRKRSRRHAPQSTPAVGG